MRARWQRTLQAIALNHGLRKGKVLWTATGWQALQDLALPDYSAPRREELLGHTQPACLSLRASYATKLQKQSPIYLDITDVVRHVEKLDFRKVLRRTLR